MTPPRPEPQDGAAELAALRALIGGTASGTVRLPILTGSMSPAILPGDVLLVKPAPGYRVHAGDVAVFLKGGQATAHRVVFALRMRDRAFLLEMGDANRLAAPLSQGAIVGFVEGIERGGERLAFARGATDADARRRARAMLWRFLARTLPVELLRIAIDR